MFHAFIRIKKNIYSSHTVAVNYLTDWGVTKVIGRDVWIRDVSGRGNRAVYVGRRVNPPAPAGPGSC